MLTSEEKPRIGFIQGKGKGGFMDKVKVLFHDICEMLMSGLAHILYILLKSHPNFKCGIYSLYEKMEEIFGGNGKPTASVSRVHFLKMNLEMVDMVVDVLVKNPNHVPIPLEDIKYLIESDGRKFVTGFIPDAGRIIKARGKETVKIPMSLNYDEIKSAYDDIHPGMIIPYKIKVGLTLDVQVFGRLTLSSEKQGKIPIPMRLEVDIEKIKIKKFSLIETEAILNMKVTNTNDFVLRLTDLDCEVWLSGVSIGKTEISRRSIKLDKSNGSGLIEVPSTLRAKDFGNALWDMIRDKGTKYTIKGNVDVDTPFGAMKLPIIKEGIV